MSSIGEWAFRSCLALQKIVIPAGVTDIAEEAFLECPALSILAEPGSYAERYAQRHGISHVADEADEPRK